MDIYNTHLGWGEPVNKIESKKINRVAPEDEDVVDRFNRFK